MINGRDPEACGARWLDQPVEPYAVARPLEEGDVIETGNTAWRVLHTPGHTLGHISLYEPSHRVLVLGDALHRDDVGWINPYTEGADALDRSIEVVERLARLDVGAAYSGHGAPIEDFPATAAAALRRLRRWREDPRALAWHACKRIFTHALIAAGGMTRQEAERHLMAAPWFADYARRGFGLEPARFIPELVAEILRSGAAEWRDGKLTARAHACTPRPGWQSGPGLPEHWPPPQTAGRETIARS
jgi:hydroxyacylglutathione hydrolase